jgi:hypothetical protein
VRECHPITFALRATWSGEARHEHDAVRDERGKCARVLAAAANH